MVIAIQKLCAQCWLLQFAGSLPCCGAAIGVSGAACTDLIVCRQINADELVMLQLLHNCSLALLHLINCPIHSLPVCFLSLAHNAFLGSLCLRLCLLASGWRSNSHNIEGLHCLWGGPATRPALQAALELSRGTSQSAAQVSPAQHYASSL